MAADTVILFKEQTTDPRIVLPALMLLTAVRLLSGVTLTPTFHILKVVKF